MHLNSGGYERKTVIVVDSNWNGHIPTYNKIICKHLLQAGHKVISASPQPDDVAEYIHSLGLTYNNNDIELRHLNLDPYPGQQETKQIAYEPVVNTNKEIPKPGLKARVAGLLKNINTFKRFFLIAENWRILNDDITKKVRDKNIIVFIPYLELWVHPFITAAGLDKRFYYPWFGIYLHLEALSTLKPLNTYNIFTSRHCKGLLVLNEDQQQQVQRRIKKPVLLFPDITNTEYTGTYSSATLNAIKECKVRGQKIVLLPGVINEHKNVFTFLDAAQLALKNNYPYTFVIAGRTSKYFWKSEANYRRFLDMVKIAPANMLVKLDGMKDGDEYNSYIVNSDAIFVSYLNFRFSSNTLTKAGFFKRPVIVSKGNLMEERVNRHKLGQAISPESPTELLQCLKVIFGGQQKDTAGFNEYYILNAEERINLVLEQLIK